jgi:hemerythrin-like domain-containing protein
MIDTVTPVLSPALDFARPLELLRAGHAHIRRQCDALSGLMANLKKQGCDSAARETSAQVIQKLDVVTYHHREDEEQDLLPRMVASATKGRGSSLTNMVADITTEHRVLRRAWTELRAELQDLAAGDRKTLDPLAVDRFVKLYRTHILMEEAAVYPLAELLLSNEDLEAMAAHMAHRRGVSPD